MLRDHNRLFASLSSLVSQSSWHLRCFLALLYLVLFELLRRRRESLCRPEALEYRFKRGEEKLGLFWSTSLHFGKQAGVPSLFSFSPVSLSRSNGLQELRRVLHDHCCFLAYLIKHAERHGDGCACSRSCYRRCTCGRYPRQHRGCCDQPACIRRRFRVLVNSIAEGRRENSTDAM